MRMGLLRRKPFLTLAIACLLGSACGHLFAQNKTEKPVAAKTALSEEQSKGEGLFLQRCSICHLPRHLKDGSPPVVGPSLRGVLKTAGPDQEKAIRQFILKGSPNMPGFQYALSAKEMDELISYLKTM